MIPSPAANSRANSNSRNRRGAAVLHPLSAQSSRFPQRTLPLVAPASCRLLGFARLSLRRDRLLRLSAKVTTPRLKISPPSLTFAPPAPLTLRHLCSLCGELFSSLATRHSRHATSSRFPIGDTCYPISILPLSPEPNS
jgi:hypothetical protein